jgi:ubiquinone/menaquinone biosynthesis C-methylase UbiE
LRITDSLANETLDRGSGFHSVDASMNRGYFVDYLDTLSSQGFARAYKQQTFMAMKVKAGDKVLDVGCGTGEDVVSLAKMVGEKGRAVGIDNSKTMVSEAKKRAKDCGALNARFHLGSAERIDFDNNSFDSCRSDRVFQHLSIPEKALSEMIRVARKGSGRIVVVDPDWETLVIDSEDKELTRKIVNLHCDAMKNPWSGRKLYSMFKRAGLRDVAATQIVPCFTDYKVADILFELESSAELASGTGLVSVKTAEEWTRDLRKRSEKGVFFASVCGFLLAGTKP